MISPLVLASQCGVIIVLSVLGGFVLWHRGRSRPGQLLALFCFLNGGWVVVQAAEGMLLGQVTPESLLLLRGLEKTFAAFTMAAFVGFVWHFPSRSPGVKCWHFWSVGLIALFFAAGSFTQWDAESVEIVSGHLQIQYGPLHYAFAWYIILSGLYAFGFLVYRYRKSPSLLIRSQITWVAVGIGISFLLAVHFTLLLPILFDVQHYQFIGTLAPAIGVLFLAYAIVKYRVMEIQVVLNRTLTWLLMSVVLFVANFGIAALIGGWIRGLNTWQLALTGTLLFYPLFFLTRRIQPTINRLLQRDYHAMAEAVDRLMDEAGELTDLQTLSRFIIERTRQVLRVPDVVLLVHDERLGRFVRIDSQKVEATDLTTDDPFLTWLAENAVTLEREQMEQRARHEALRPLARPYFELVSAEACLTLVKGGKLIGTLNLGRREGTRWQLTRRELELITRFRSAITMALENARLYESELALKEKKVQAEFFARELREAHEMQASLLPRSAPEVAGLEAAGDCRPALDVGGDFYDYLVTGDGTVSVILGDVSGKGLKSAMHAVLSSGLLRTRVRVGGTPGEVLAEVNLDLYQLTERNIFTAISFAAIDGRCRKLTLINAGLPYPLHQRGEKVRSLRLAGLPLGVMPRQSAGR